jgi:hypothetical protein
MCWSNIGFFLLVIEYIVPFTSGEERDNTLVRVLISKVSKLEKL